MTYGAFKNPTPHAPQGQIAAKTLNHGTVFRSKFYTPEL